MPNRQLTKDELPKAINLLNEVRTKLLALAGEDKGLLFAFRRKLFKELIYDERSKPMDRRALKAKVRKAQEGTCPECRQALPETYCVLDRTNAADGYVLGNVRLLCEPCDRKIQIERRYA
jgi:hypothetical protein